MDTIIDTLIQNVHNLNKTKEIIDIQFSEIKRFIKIGKNSSTMLLLLIEDILDLAKMEAVTFKFNMTEFRINDVINEIHDIFVDQWKLKRIGFYSNADEDLQDLTLYSDVCKIKQILMNLISNSYKFTFEGNISISVQEILFNNHSFIEFWISDTGIGIKLEDQTKLFKLYGMIRENKGLNPNGTGIGLTVSK